MDYNLNTHSPERETSITDSDVEKDIYSKRMKLNKSDKDSTTKKVDVFRKPHNRMRELVTWPLKEAASLPDVQDLQPSLQAVYEAMWELKSHEIIENEYIMEILKARLQARQVSKASNYCKMNLRRSQDMLKHISK